MWQIIAGILGEGAASMDEEQQKKLLQRSLDEFGNINIPALKQAYAEELGKSQSEGVQADQGLQAHERAALDELSRIGSSGGMTLEDKANLNRVQGDTARQEQASLNRIRDQMSRRYPGGAPSGAELSMSLANSQNAANRSYQGGLDVAAQAQKRALDAIMHGSQMAGQMDDRDFSQKMARANAADSRTRYNADARTRANAYNLGLPERDFQNRIARAQGISGQAGNLGGFYGNQANSTRQLYAGVGNGAQTWWDNEQKKNNRDDDDNGDSITWGDG